MADPYCISFASGDLGFVETTVGAPTVTNAVPPPCATYAGRIAAYDDQLIINCFKTASANYKLVAFKIYFTQLPSSTQSFLTTTNSLNIRITSTGQLQIYSAQSGYMTTASTETIKINIWYSVVCYVCTNANAACYLFVNNQLWSSGSENFSLFADTTNLKWASASGGPFYYFSEVVTEGDNSDFINRVSVSGYDVYDLMAKTGCTTSGTALDSGAWTNTGEQPASTTNYALYSASSAAGYALTDGTSKNGPVGSVTGGIYCAAWFYNLKRGTGSSSTHFVYTGNNIDGATNTSVGALTTSSTWYFHINYTYGGDYSGDYPTNIPQLTEKGLIGGSVSGAQDLYINEAYLSYAVKKPGLAFNPLFKRRPYSVRI